MSIKRKQYIVESLKIAGLFLVIFFISTDIFAQPGPPSGSPQCGGPFGTCVPIDGGASLLLALGALFGGKKLFSLNKKAN